jgi:glutamate/tyrosine decarboxylase-like PLP-dependent enzyme
MFLSLAAAGWRGYGEHVERCVELTELLKTELARRKWAIANCSPLAVLCIKPPPGFPKVRSIVDQVLASGRAWIAATVFEGSDVIRVCVTHGETSADDIIDLVHTLQS